MPCGATNSGHCCWIEGQVCPFLSLEDRPACTLRRGLRSWQAVHEDPRYLERVRPTMERLGVDCGDWPPKGQTCAECGLNG